ncbi:hypothetical protein EAE96_000030 [Botrytis aclada]|nr:hypothetical protein EAE96_000030 [Botrytis aclada]
MYTLGIRQANQQAKAHLTHFSNFGKAWLGMVRMTTYHYWLIYSKRPTVIIVLGRDIKEAMAMIIMTITSSFECSCMRDFRALCGGGRFNEPTTVAVLPYSHRRSLLPSLSDNIVSVMLLERGNKDWGPGNLGAQSYSSYRIDRIVDPSMYHASLVYLIS